MTCCPGSVQVQIQPKKHVQAHAAFTPPPPGSMSELDYTNQEPIRYAAPTGQRELLEHTEHTDDTEHIDHTDQYMICPETSPQSMKGESTMI